MRTVLVAGLVLSGAIVGVSATVGTGIAAIDGTVADALATISEEAPVAAEDRARDTPVETDSEGEPVLDGDRWSGDGTATPEQESPPGTWPNGYNRTKVEMLFIAKLNRERSSRELQEVQRRAELTQMARAHSENMATHEYLGHEEPDGDTIEDRYRARGLLPECNLETSEGTYYPGAENAYQGYVDTRLAVDWKQEYHRAGDEESLAEAIFQSWMHSKGHREAMLVESADEAGLSFAFVEGSDKLYGSLELC